MSITQDWFMALIIGIGIGAVVIVSLFAAMPVEFSGGLMASLKGKKTYIVATLGVAVFLGEQFGLVPVGWGNKIDTALLFVGLGTMRSAIANLNLGAVEPETKPRPNTFNLTDTTLSRP